MGCSRDAYFSGLTVSPGSQFPVFSPCHPQLVTHSYSRLHLHPLPPIPKLSMESYWPGLYSTTLSKPINSKGNGTACGLRTVQIECLGQGGAQAPLRHLAPVAAPNWNSVSKELAQGARQLDRQLPEASIAAAPVLKDLIILNDQLSSLHVLCVLVSSIGFSSVFCTLAVQMCSPLSSRTWLSGCAHPSHPAPGCPGVLTPLIPHLAVWVYSPLSSRSWLSGCAHPSHPAPGCPGVLTPLISPSLAEWHVLSFLYHLVPLC